MSAHHTLPSRCFEYFDQTGMAARKIQKTGIRSGIPACDRTAFL